MRLEQRWSSTERRWSSTRAVVVWPGRSCRRDLELPSACRGGDRRRRGGGSESPWTAAEVGRHARRAVGRTRRQHWSGSSSRWRTRAGRGAGRRGQGCWTPCSTRPWTSASAGSSTMRSRRRLGRSRGGRTTTAWAFRLRCSTEDCSRGCWIRGCPSRWPPTGWPASSLPEVGVVVTGASAGTSSVAEAERW